MSHSTAINYPVLELLPEDLEKKLILDFGMGLGDWGQLIKSRKKGFPILIGIEKYRKYFERHRELIALEWSPYEDVRLGGVERLSEFDDQTIDIFMACEVIEHMSREEGLKLMDEAERITRELIIFSTPEGYMRVTDDPENPYGVHRTGWREMVFESRGYHTIRVDMRSQMTKTIRAVDSLRRAIFRLHNGKEILAWKFTGGR